MWQAKTFNTTWRGKTHHCKHDSRVSIRVDAWMFIQICRQHKFVKYTWKFVCRRHISWSQLCIIVIIYIICSFMLLSFGCIALQCSPSRHFTSCPWVTKQSEMTTTWRSFKWSCSPAARNWARAEMWYSTAYCMARKQSPRGGWGYFACEVDLNLAGQK